MTAFLRTAAVCLAGLFCLPLSAADRVALVIGNADYAEPSLFPDLKFAGKDAELVADTLEDLGFKVIFVQDASKQAIYTRLLEFEEAIEEGGAALFYFAGHGVEFEKKNYLAGTNAIFRDRDLLFEEAMDADIVISKMLGAGPKTAMVFLDCCRESPPQSWVMSLKKTRGLNTVGLAPMQTRPGLVVGFAASAGNLANDSLGGDHGPFALALTKHMKAGAEISDVLKLTGREVNQLSLEMKQQNPDETGIVIQEPAVYGQIYHDFYFSPDGKPRETNDSQLAAMEQQIAAMKKTIEELRKAGVENESLKEQLATMEASLENEKTTRPDETKTMAVTQPEEKPAYPATRGMEGSKAGETRTFGGIEFVWCPPTGEEGFLMGSPTDEPERDDDETQHRVILTKGFWMAKTECTQGQWESVKGSNPSHFKGSKNLPVEQVNWMDVERWLEKINEKYPLPEGWRWELPTEAQWEYACRAGTKTVFSFGDTLGSDQVNCNGNLPYGGAAEGRYLQETTEVGSYRANAWGLMDMHGNVYEWCADWYGDYAGGLATDPQGATDGSDRVARGGSWRNSGHYCRSADRYWAGQYIRNYYMGFRLAIRFTQ